MQTLRNTLAILFLLCIGIYGQSIAQKQAKIEQKLKEINQKLAEEMVKGNFTYDHYLEDAISMPNNAPMLVGLDAIKVNMDQALAAGMKFESFTTTISKIMVDDKIVTEIGSFDITISIPNVPTISEKGKYLTIWELQKNGDLKIKVETWNTNTMPGQY